LLFVERRDGQRRHIGKDLRARLVEIDRTTARLLGRRLVAREIRADLAPGAAVVVALQDILRADQQLLRIVRGEEDRMRPAEAVFLFPGGGALQVIRPGTGVAVLSGLQVIAEEDAEIAGAKGDVGVPWLWGNKGALAVGDVMPVADRDHAVGSRAGAREGA